MQKNKTIVVVAGNSGGHIIPGLTLARAQYNQGARIIFVTPDGQLDKKLVAQETWIAHHELLQLGPVPRAWWKLPGYGVSFVRTIMQLVQVLKTYKPDEIIGMGGYPCIPAVVAARFLHIPCDMYELNVIPGEAVKLLARWCRNVFICFEKTRSFLPGAHCEKRAYPVRFTEHTVTRDQACRELGFDPAKKILLVLGGSQGSQFMNQLMIDVLGEFGDVSRLQIIHQTGEQGAQRMSAWYAEQGIPAHVFAFSSDMAPCYGAADLVIARAGAGTLFELLFFQKKSVIIPLITKTTDHQRDNAYAMAGEYPELFTVIDQSTQTKYQLLELLPALR